MSSARALVTSTVHALPASTCSLIAQALRQPGAAMRLHFDPASSCTRLDLVFANGSTANLLTVEPEPESGDDEDDGFPTLGYGSSSVDRIRGGRR